MDTVFIPLPKDKLEALNFDFKKTTKYLSDKIREGYGEGFSEGYQSWVGFSEVSSEGVTSQPKAIKLDRQLLLLSLIEKKNFLRTVFKAGFVDFNENVRVPRELTLEAAKALRVRHPTYKHTAIPMVMTIDSKRSYLDQSHRLVEDFVDCKSSSHLKLLKKINGLRLHRYAAEKMGFPYGVFTEKNCTEAEYKTLGWLHNSVKDNTDIGSENEQQTWVDLRQHLARAEPNETATSFAKQADKDRKLPPGSVMAHICSLIWQHFVEIPFNNLTPHLITLQQMRVANPASHELYLDAAQVRAERRAAAAHSKAT